MGGGRRLLPHSAAEEEKEEVTSPFSSGGEVQVVHMARHFRWMAGAAEQELDPQSDVRAGAREQRVAGGGRRCSLCFEPSRGMHSRVMQ